MQFAQDYCHAGVGDVLQFCSKSNLREYILSISSFSECSLQVKCRPMLEYALEMLPDVKPAAVDPSKEKGEDALQDGVAESDADLGEEFEQFLEAANGCDSRAAATPAPEETLTSETQAPLSEA